MGLGTAFSWITSATRRKRLTDGQELRRKRKRLSLSQATLAKRLGVPQGRVSSWERGDYAMPEVVRRWVYRK